VYYEELCETRIILSLLQHLQLQFTKQVQHDGPLAVRIYRVNKICAAKATDF